MNSVIMSAVVVRYPKTSETKDGALKCAFTVTTDGRDLPLHFQVVCFGNAAQTASTLVAGDEVLLSGRLTASAITRRMSIIAHAVELLFEAEDEAVTTEKSQ